MPPPALTFRRLLGPLFGRVVAILIAVVVGGILVALLGNDPIEVYWTLIQGSLVGWPNLSVALQMTTPLIFTGLAVAFSFRAGLWNIGAEGQMLVGALFAGHRRLCGRRCRPGCICPPACSRPSSAVRCGLPCRRCSASISTSTSWSSA